jgi:4-amino-4-deoxy-L-arabinose transferase-like glycosyltransferase
VTLRTRDPARPLLSHVEWLCIILILLLAAGLRFVALDWVPPALNVDEAVNGYEAYSLLKTGRDEWGNAWPVTIRAFNDYRRPAIVYTAIPFIALFGLNTFAIRATAAMWGWLTVLLIYRLARDMLGRRVGLLAGLMLAISPWHAQFSRSGREATVAMFTIVLGVWCGWRWFRSRRPAWLIGAGLAFGSSLYTYNTTLAFTPLMLAACGLMFARSLWRQKGQVAIAALVVLLVAAPLVYVLTTNPYTQNRQDAVTLFRPGASLSESLLTVGRQWLGHFSPDYLFIHGDAHPVLHPQGSGQLYAVEALLLPLGVLGIFSTLKSRRAGMLLLVWIALGPVPAALTIQEMGTAHSLRGMLGVPALAILSARGVMTVWDARRLGSRLRAALLGALAGLLIWNAATTWQRYFVVYPVQAAPAFEYGTQQAVDYVTAHENEYDTIVLTNWISQPHIFVLFFQRYDPRRFQAGPVEYSQKLSAKVKRWDQYVVGDVDKLYAQLEHGLFVARPHMLPGIKPVQVIYYPDGSPAFKIVSK